MKMGILKKPNVNVRMGREKVYSKLSRLSPGKARGSDRGKVSKVR